MTAEIRVNSMLAFGGRGGRRLEAEKLRECAGRGRHADPAANGAGDNPEFTLFPVSLGIDMTDELGAGEYRQRIIAPAASRRRGVDFPSVIEIPEGGGDAAVVDERIEGREQQRRGFGPNRGNRRNRVQRSGRWRG